MNKYVFSMILLMGMISTGVQAQFGMGIGMGMRGRFGYGGIYSGPGYRNQRSGNSMHKKDSADIKFQPELTFSVGYGLPNLDASQFAGFQNYVQGNASQTGRFIGSLDYRYNLRNSIGLSVSHGQVQTSYYDYAGNHALDASMDNWAVMLNLINYMSSGAKVEPYLRTALGVNLWNQQYIDASGNTINYISTPSQFAYQVSLGVNMKLLNQSAVFVEAGYGKYILQAGMKFKL